jgi:hypothetical protein
MASCHLCTDSSITPSKTGVICFDGIVDCGIRPFVGSLLNSSTEHAIARSGPRHATSTMLSEPRDSTSSETHRDSACTTNTRQVTVKCDKPRVSVGPLREEFEDSLQYFTSLTDKTAQFSTHPGNLTISSRFLFLFSTPRACVKVHQKRPNIDWFAGTSDTTTCGLTEAQPPHVDRCHASPWAA